MVQPWFPEVPMPPSNCGIWREVKRKPHSKGTLIRLSACRLVVHSANNCRVGPAGAGSARAGRGTWRRSLASCLPPRQSLQQVEQVVLGELPVERLGLPVGQFLVQPDPQLQLL